MERTTNPLLPDIIHMNENSRHAGHIKLNRPERVCIKGEQSKERLEILIEILTVHLNKVRSLRLPIP
jgi:hypothetical protein